MSTIQRLGKQIVSLMETLKIMRTKLSGEVNENLNLNLDLSANFFLYSMLDPSVVYFSP